jgi:hypothetical protein
MGFPSPTSLRRKKAKFTKAVGVARAKPEILCPTVAVLAGGGPQSHAMELQTMSKTEGGRAYVGDLDVDLEIRRDELSYPYTFARVSGIEANTVSLL